MDLSTLEDRLQGVRLDIHQPDGQIVHLGYEGPVVNWHLRSRAALRGILKQPQRLLGHSYVRGEWDIDPRRLPMLIQTLIPRDNGGSRLGGRSVAGRLRRRIDRMGRTEPPPLWSDVSPWLSRICLGEELFQGCGQYREPGTTTEQAQRLSCRDLAARLQLTAGQHVLDLRAGWGSLPLYLAEHADVRVTALVSTREQLRFAQNEARRRGLDGVVHFRLGDFCQCRGHFDRILAAGFLGHHPEAAYRVLLGNLQALLREGGLLWLQAIGRSSEQPLDNRWYQAQLPARHSLPLFPHLIAEAELAGLRTLATEDLSECLLRDLESRARRYYGRRTAISERFGELRTRHWEFLLASEISALRSGQLRQFEVILGTTHTRPPTTGPAPAEWNAHLPRDITSKIPGLARDI